MGKLRVLIVDDDPLVRVALSHFVSKDADITVVAEASDGHQALEAVGLHQPDIVMMDIQMPGMDGIETTRKITEAWPHIRVLAVTTLNTRDTVLPMLSAGATGYMLKDSSADEIVAALRQAYEGTSSLSPQIAAMLVRHVRSSHGGASPSGELAPITERETDVLQHLGRGMSNAEMAAALHLSEGTIKAHLGSIMSKWHVRDRVQVLVAAARAGLITFD